MRWETTEEIPLERAGGTGWPGRACCCSAPPVIKVLLPTRDHGLVDLFLCGHHYRASLGPLALADSTATFRESPWVVSLVRARS